MLGDIFYFKLSASGDLISQPYTQCCVLLDKMGAAMADTASLWIVGNFPIPRFPPVIYTGQKVKDAAARKGISVRDLVVAAYTRHYKYNGRDEEHSGNDLTQEYTRVQRTMYIQDGVIADIERVLHSSTLSCSEQLRFVSTILTDYSEVK